MILFSNGLHVSPIDFLWGQFMPFSRAEGEGGDRRSRVVSRRRSADARNTTDDTPGRRECSAVSAYQMGCLAQQMSCGGFDALPGLRCACECSGERCLERLR